MFYVLLRVIENWNKSEDITIKKIDKLLEVQIGFNIQLGVPY